MGVQGAHDNIHQTEHPSRFNALKSQSTIISGA